MYVLDIFYFQILKKCKINDVFFKKIERNQVDGDNDDDDDDYDYKMILQIVVYYVLKFQYFVVL